MTNDTFELGMGAVILPLVWVWAKREEKRREWAKGFHPAQVLGDAALVTEKQLKRAGYFKPGGIRIGLSPNGKNRLFYHGKGHILITASARSGKLFTVLAALIMSLGKRGLVGFDAKGEMTCVVGRVRKKYGEFYVLNPFGIHLEFMKGLKQASYNIMDILEPDSPKFSSYCDKIADAFRPQSVGSDSHWWDSAAQLISGVIGAIAKYGHPDDRNLVAVRAVLTGSLGRTVFDFCRECMAMDDQDIKQKLARFAISDAEAKDNKEFASIVSCAITRTAIVTGAIAENMKRSTFRFRDLKRKPGMTVMICLPINMFDVCSPWTTLNVAGMLAELLDETGGYPVLAVIDEISQIGYLKALEDAWGMAAGACGLQILAVYQSVSQIVNQFPKTWSNIIQNSGVTLWWACNDHQTRKVVSELAGVTEVIGASRGEHFNRRLDETEYSFNMSQSARPLLHPEEVGRLPEDKMWMFCERINGVVKATRKPYLKEFPNAGPNPYFVKGRK